MSSCASDHVESHSRDNQFRQDLIDVKWHSLPQDQREKRARHGAVDWDTRKVRHSSFLSRSH